MQKNEANSQFGKFVERNYVDWLNHPEDAPTMSHNLFNKHVIPEIKNEFR